MSGETSWVLSLEMLVAWTFKSSANALLVMRRYVNVYDPMGRLTQTAHGRGGTNLATYSLSYDAANRIARLTTSEGTTKYSYDARDQLRAADHSDQTDESYTYDANGNRKNTGYQTVTPNRLSSDGVFTYQYDNEGNRIRRTRLTQR